MRGGQWIERGFGMTEKKVVFIGGSSYSGSTFLDMILSTNGDNGFFADEVSAFYLYRSHHINPECRCVRKALFDNP